MAVINLKKALVYIEIRVQGFSRSLATILSSDFRNARWLSQFGNDNFEKSKIMLKFGMGVFEVSDHDLAIIYSKLKITEPIWRLEI